MAEFFPTVDETGAFVSEKVRASHTTTIGAEVNKAVADIEGTGLSALGQPAGATPTAQGDDTWEWEPATTFSGSYNDLTDVPPEFPPADHPHEVSDLTTTGTPDAGTFLRGDGVWAVPPSGGGGGPILAPDGRYYRLVSCVLRNTAGTWNTITDAGHAATGVASVETLSDRIRVHYNFTATKVSSLQVTPDETLGSDGMRVGASVGLTYADIMTFREETGLGDYVSYDGSKWVSFAGVFTNLSYNSSTGTLTLTHRAVGGAATNPRGAATARDSTWRVGLGSLAETSTQVQFLQVGTAGYATTPATSMKVWVERFGRVVTPVAPATINQAGNLWVTGLMEVEPPA